MNVVPAGIVLYKPDSDILGRLLRRLSTDGRRLFIFVNGPLTPCVDTLLTEFPEAYVIRSPHNIGQGSALNAIAEAAAVEGFRHLVLFDQDSEPMPDLAEQLLAQWHAGAADGVPLAIVAPLLVPPAEGRYRQIRYSWRAANGLGALSAVHFAPTSGSLLSLAAFKDVGPFREDFIVGGIDLEWCFRAWSRGYASVVVRDRTMLHRWGEEAAPNVSWQPQILRHPPIRKYYYIRNAVYSLRFGFIPVSWRLRYALWLCLQLGLLVVSGCSIRLVCAAVADGARGRLGLVRPELLRTMLS